MASSSDSSLPPLYLSTPPYSISCKLHPVVIFSILDHYSRRNESQDRTIGTLLGTINDGVVDIKNCFPVPHTETDLIAVDMEVHRRMFELHNKANPKEVIVGWYATGTDITELSVVHDFYWKEIGHSPIHLLIDTGLTNNAMDIKAYTSTSLSPSTSSPGISPAAVSTPQASVPTTSLSRGSLQFLPAKLELESTDSERIGLEALLRGRGEGPTVTALPSEMQSLELNLSQLLNLLDTVTAYTDKVVNKEVKGDNDLGRFLANTVTSLPTMEPSATDKIFNDGLQDLLMVTYLANLTRSQLVLADRSSKLLKESLP